MSFLSHESHHRRGKVPFGMIYRRKYPAVHRDPYFELPTPFCVMFATERYFPIYYSPNIFECLLCHSDKYKRGKVSLGMLVNFDEKQEYVSSRAAKMEKRDVRRMLKTARHYAVTS